MKSKKAAIEMTMGTVVTIVLMVAVLIVILFFINKVRESGTDALDSINEATKTEINEVFGQDAEKKLSIYPSSRKGTIEKGEDGEIGFSIRNTDSTEGTFSYEVMASSIGTGCEMSLAEVDSFISLGQSGENIALGSGDILENPKIIRFDIPETASLCLIRYNINIYKNGGNYASTDFDLEILAK